MNFDYNNQTYNIQRHPLSNNKSLKAWSAADEYILNYLDQNSISKEGLVIFNDRFGFLSCLLHPYQPTTITSHKSQEKAILQNQYSNNIPPSAIQMQTILKDPVPKSSLALLKVPKSLELFQFFLFLLNQQIAKEALVVASFMTRHFSPKLLSIAAQFFEQVEQSKAWKKSRLLLLRQPKKNVDCNFVHSIPFKEQVFQQYFGVFSAGHIDYASQFLIQHLPNDNEYTHVLDLASGNGILAATMRQKAPNCSLHLLDDFYLAIASSKRNLSPHNTFFHYNNNLETFSDHYFDCILSNPPFHFEYEVNIEIAIGLFKEVKRCLKKNGDFFMVANKHLNYKTHLNLLFPKVHILKENQKFIIYKCSNS